MFFLLRMAFWLGVVLILLPSFSAQPSAPAGEVHAAEAISAASATVADLRGFCARQPDACTVGSQVATTLGYKAQAGAKMLYDFLTEAMAPRETGTLSSGNARRGSTATSVLDKTAPGGASQNTLTPTDLTPAWRGPAARKDAKHSV